MNRNNKKIHTSMLDLIGETPMVWLQHNDPTVKAKIALKLECENPLRSVKDRLGLGIIRKAEAAGQITPGKSTLFEATSGNTGIALAFVGKLLGYKVVIVMPETMSMERRCMLKILGATLVLTPSVLGLKASIMHAQRLAMETPGGFLVGQFDSKFNAAVHYETTAPEIWEQTDHKIDYLVAGVGTGGTLGGIAQFLKDAGSNAKIVAIEPAESAVLSGCRPGPHKIQGIGAGFVPRVFMPFLPLISEVINVSSADAIATGRWLPETCGVLCGISSGAAVHAAMEIGRRAEAEGKVIVVIVGSYGERYLSTPLFDDIRTECSSIPVLSPSDFEFSNKH
eukprot:PhM_4_TR15197/c0_g1_i1/m.93753/K01738/cysK; cysteine synthase A